MKSVSSPHHLRKDVVTIYKNGMCLAHPNRYQQTHFVIFRVDYSGEPISSGFGYRYRFPFWRVLLAGITSPTKIGIKRAIQGELNTYVFRNPHKFVLEQKISFN